MRNVKVFVHGGRMASTEQDDLEVKDQSAMKLFQEGCPLDGTANSKPSDDMDGQSSIHGDPDDFKHESALKCVQSVKESVDTNGIARANGEVRQIDDKENRKSTKNGAIIEKNIFSVIGGPEIPLSDKGTCSIFETSESDQKLERLDLVLVKEKYSQENTETVNKVLEEIPENKDEVANEQVGDNTEESVCQDTSSETGHESQSCITDSLVAKQTKESSSSLSDSATVNDNDIVPDKQSNSEQGITEINAQNSSQCKAESNSSVENETTEMDEQDASVLNAATSSAEENTVTSNAEENTVTQSEVVGVEDSQSSKEETSLKPEYSIEPSLAGETSANILESSDEEPMDTNENELCSEVSDVKTESVQNSCGSSVEAMDVINKETEEIKLIRDDEDLKEKMSDKNTDIAEDVDKVLGPDIAAVQSNSAEMSTARTTSESVCITSESSDTCHSSSSSSNSGEGIPATKVPMSDSTENSENKPEPSVSENDKEPIVKPLVPKKAKARKSLPQASKANIPVVSFTNLTFNVKELEKKGVLDIPKKVADASRLKVKFNMDKGSLASKKGSPNRSPVRSPAKSPKTESPFFKEKTKILKARKRKVKRLGVYKLPGELKKAKKRLPERERKKESEEKEVAEKRDVEVPEVNVENKTNTSEVDKTESLPAPVCSLATPTSTPDKMAAMSSADSGKPKDVECTPPMKQTQSALDMIKKNSQLSFMVSPNVKKAKKMIKSPLMDSRSQTRTLDAFLKVTYPRLSSTISRSQGPVSEPTIKTEPPEIQNSAFRKRKTTEEEDSSSKSSAPQSEEKKRKTSSNETLVSSPPQLITVINPSTTLPVQNLRSIIPATVSGVQNQITLLTPASTPQNFIPTSGFKAVPIVQILNGPGNPTSGGVVNVAFTPGTVSQGKSILGHQIPGTPLLQAKNAQGLPVYLAPVQVSSSPLTAPGIAPKPLFVQNNIIQSGSLTVPSRTVLNTMARDSGTSVLNQLLTRPAESLLQVKREPKIGQVPNGLSYPVTPPRTPDEQADSDSCSQESVGVSPGGPTPPDKDTIPLCTCRISGASFQKMATSVTYCQALDSVDGKVMGCCNKVTNAQLVRPGVKIPFMSVCEQHRKRLRLHNCCPGCGHFCTQGKFYRCRKEGAGSQHHFHQLCQVMKHGKNYCPHCGEESQQLEVHLSLEDTQQTTTTGTDAKSSRIQLKAKMSVGLKRSSKSDEDDDPEKVVISRTLDKSKKSLSTRDIPVGPDRIELEKVLSGLGQERPKKYRNLPKCLYNPAFEKDLEKVAYMLEDGHDPNEQYEDLDDQTALHGAAASGSLAIVHILIQAGATIHCMDKKLCTPLMYAAENNHVAVVKYLVRAGAIMDSKADDGMTALHHAAKAGHVEVMKVLLDTEQLDINITDDGGWTPLIWAAEHQKLDAVKFLMKRGTDPNLRDSEENTSLHWAAYSGSVEIAEVFLNAGCELDSPNMHGDRPLHIAARQDHYEVVVLFLARGADVEGKNLKNETPMECCIDQTSPVWLALRVNRQLKGFAAKRMGRPEKLLHRDISKGRENIPIPCVNCCDDDGVPGDYQYVTDNVETTCLNINRVLGSLQCCQCKDDCSSLYCACGKSSVKCWYDKNGRLVPEFNMLEPPLIFECNKACQCWTTCNNRVVQNGVMSRLQVFKTSGRGWGCRTLVNIPRGTFICEYIGEHISDSEADRREDDSYLFDLDNRDGETYCIDARRYGNVSRFINHLCEPNLVPVKVFIDYQDLRFPRICFFASRDIIAMEELGFDYGEKFWIIKYKHFTCECGSPKCRFSKDTIQKTIEDYKLRHEEDIDATKETK